MRDRMTMRIRRPELDVTEKQVEDAFNALSTADQESFLNLHEGRSPYPTRTLRIFKANAFGDETCAWLCLKIARLNHLCAPNAELTETDNERDVKVVAIKSIAKSEEIFISYNGSLEEGSKVERAQVMKETYGFECHCVVCTLEGREADLSDARRHLINAISHKLAGLEPSHIHHISNVNSAFSGQGLKVVGRYKQKLRAPLTPHENVAYNLLLAGLLEIEGLVGYELAKSYVTAALGLLGQLHGLKSMVILPAARYVDEWMEKAVSVMKKIRTNGSRDLDELLQAWKSVQKSAHLRLAKSFVRCASYSVCNINRGRKSTDDSDRLQIRRLSSKV